MFWVLSTFLPVSWATPAAKAQLFTTFVMENQFPKSAPASCGIPLTGGRKTGSKDVDELFFEIHFVTDIPILSSVE
ncbi:MAG: hypothetical protein D6732_00105 [Methanobacteriota archaeon]|nr:MAG: hypothetical protein D6732_00105 [Euryarchaeota archaeon]